LKNEHGRSYPKKIPLVGQMFKDGHHYDFFLGSHHVSENLDELENLLKDAKKRGEPYNMMVMESAHQTHDGRKLEEDRANKWVSQIQTEQMHISESEAGIKKLKKNTPEYEKLRKTAEESRRKLEGLKEFERVEDANARAFYKEKKPGRRLGGTDGFAMRSYRLAADHDLHIKTSEAWSPEEAKRVQGLLNATLEKHPEMSYEDELNLFVRNFAEHMHYRDGNIARTLGMIKTEVKDHPKFKENPIRAIVILGSNHDNVPDLLDRSTFSDVGIAHHQKRGPKPDFEDFYAAVDEAKALSRRPLAEIRNFDTRKRKR
jgi:hypothetical protein